MKEVISEKQQRLKSIREYLEKHYAHESTSEIAKLFNLSAKQISMYAFKFGIKKGVPKKLMEIKKYLKKHYSDERTEDIAKALGITAKQVRSYAAKFKIKKSEYGLHIANADGAKKRVSVLDGDIYDLSIDWSKTRFKKLTKKEIEYFCQNYPVVSTKEIAEEMGITEHAARGYASFLGVKKNKYFLAQLRKDVARRLVQHNNEVGFDFRKNLINYTRTNTPDGEEKFQKAIEKGRKKRNEAIKAEKRRLLFGLPQQTKLKLINHSKKVNYRYRLRKVGYIEVEPNIFQCPEKRHYTMEERAKEFCLKFIE